MEGISTPVVSDGVLYFSVEDSQGTSLVLAVRASDGTELWHAMAPTAGVAGPVVVASNVVCYSYQSLNGAGSDLVGLHAADGSLAWRISIEASGPIPLAADNSVIYTGIQTKSAGGLGLTLSSYAASTGRLLSTHPLPQLASPYLGFQLGSQFQVVAGNIDLVVTGPAASGGTVTQQSPIVSDIISLSASDGTLRWQDAVNGDVTQVLIAP
jgi:outer membrane protein assembly factor BamB